MMTIALISVSDKAGLADFGKGLAAAGVEMYSTGGTRKALEAMGHTLGPSDGSFGGYQAIMRDSDQGVYYGASEVRKDGQAAGY